jgi:hypothetical protein
MALTIGINGYAGSGKSAIAQHLVEKNWARLKFADPLKAAIRALLLDMGTHNERIDRMIEGDLKELRMARLNGKSPREVMQWLGAGARGPLGDDFYVNILMSKRIKKFSDRSVVIDDLRYKNEATAIRAMGGYIIRVERPHVGPVNGHESENLVEDYDILIENNGSLADLHGDIYAAMQLIHMWEDKKRGAA